MSTDLKKHSSIAAGEKPTRAALAAAILSINDIVPVANATEAGQVAVALAAAGQVLASTPLVVARADAPGLHRIELSTDGTVWRPASGTMHFTNDTARDSWTTANSALLAVGDVCVSNGFDGRWNGTAWMQDTAWTAPTYTGSWVDFGSGIRPGGYRRFKGKIELRGSVKSGGTGNTNPMFTLPAGMRPVSVDEQFIVIANTGYADLRIDSTGRVYIAAFNGGGNNGIVSLSGISFDPS